MLTDFYADHQARLRAAGQGGEFFEDDDWDLDEILKSLEEQEAQRTAASSAADWETVEDLDLTRPPLDEP